MFKMFNQIFSAFTVLAAALENIARAMLHLSGAAEQQAKAFADECALENEAVLIELQKKTAALKAVPQITAP